MTRKSAYYLLLAILSIFLYACSTQNDTTIPEPSPPVSKELYDKTFDQVLSFLKKTDAIIKNRDFQAWKANLTKEFIASYSDPARLKELSKKPYLKDQNIVLSSLYDYFIHVFIPSRIQSQLDKIEFIGDNRVKAITVINNVPYVVYLLEKDENNQWKIGVW